MKNITNKSEIQFNKISPFILNQKITKDFFNKNKPINALGLKVKINSYLANKIKKKENEDLKKLLENGNYEVKDYIRAKYKLYSIQKFKTAHWNNFRKFQKKKSWRQIKKNEKREARIKRQIDWRKKNPKKNKKRDWLLSGLTKIKRRKQNQYQYYKLFTNYIPFLYDWDRKKKKKMLYNKNKIT